MLLSELYEFLIGPIELVFEIIFSLLNKHIAIPGLCIVLLSLVFSIIVLPMYLRADKIQEEARDTEERLAPVIKHIKEYFKGDERFMILQTYYRQNNYSPLSVLKSSVSLLLQIPFFLAAYRMLSNNMYLAGHSFGPIANLGAPDALINLGTFTVNVLPFVMTAVNLISAAIYANKMPVKSKIQLWIMAGLFLVLLYNSPSGLVLYWTCNNLFSLIKNVIMKVRSSKTSKDSKASKSASSKRASGKNIAEDKRLKTVFIFSSIACAVFMGFFVPASVLASAPEEFVNLTSHTSPSIYLIDSSAKGLGLFLLWPSVFYALASTKGRRVISYIMFTLLCLQVVNSQLFSNTFGTMSSVLIYDVYPQFEVKTILINAGVCAGAIAIAILITRFGKSFTSVISLSAVFVFAVMGFMKFGPISEGYANAMKAVSSSDPEFTLSRGGKNVIVLMLDRALGPMVPFIFNENKELAGSFDGFTYYHNAVSFGAYTNFATPSLYGGYEYTPDKINERDNELLVDKQNEALKVMPAIFAKAGYKSTFINPSYAGYKWNPDLTIFDGMENVKAYNTLYRYTPIDYGPSYDKTIKHNLFSYSLYKAAPVGLQRFIYDGGLYNETEIPDWSTASQIQTGLHVSDGHNKEFEADYWALKSLDKMTKIDDGDSNNFLVMSSRSTHEESLLQEPEYVPADHVDNTVFDQVNQARFITGGKMLLALDSLDYMHYQINMAAFMEVAEYLKYLKDNDLYDNTRIIIVSDHGFGLNNFPELIVSKANNIDGEWFTPLLMYKDFGSHGDMVQSDELMTNADTPYLAFKDLIDSPVNPFTGKPVEAHDKSGELLLFFSTDWGVDKNNGTKYLPGQWYSVKEDIWNQNNWKYVGSD